MSLSHSGSIHVVTNDAKFKRGLPSNINSSLIIWYAASFGVSFSGSRNLHNIAPPTISLNLAPYFTPKPLKNLTQNSKRGRSTDQGHIPHTKHKAHNAMSMVGSAGSYTSAFAKCAKPQRLTHSNRYYKTDVESNRRCVLGKLALDISRGEH
jgi:hypothetical protein